MRRQRGRHGTRERTVAECDGQRQCPPAQLAWDSNNAALVRQNLEAVMPELRRWDWRVSEPSVPGRHFFAVRPYEPGLERRIQPGWDAAGDRE